MRQSGSRVEDDRTPSDTQPIFQIIIQLNLI
nr:MAG TPA: hypothetical protein [Caudoviricetes sp.]